MTCALPSAQPSAATKRNRWPWIGGAVVIAAITTAACSSSAAPGSPEGSPKASITDTSPAPAETTASKSIADRIEVGEYPACAITVGQPTSVIIDEARSSKSRIVVHCHTGPTLASDNTGTGFMDEDCTGKPVYYWASRDAQHADQQVYAARGGASVVVVPDQTAAGFWELGGELASAPGC